MKNFTLIIFFLLGQQLVGQELPDINSIFSIEPIWTYVPEDTNWYEIQFEENPHLNQYSGSFHHNSMIKGDNYYLLESSEGQTHNPPLSEGYFLHKINLNSGIPEWVHYDNFYSGNDYVETVFGGHMHFNPEGNIVVNGFKSLDSIKNISFEGFDFRVYVNVMRDVINNNDGHLLEHRVDLDTSRTIDKLHPGRFLLRKVSNNRQVKHKFENVFEDGLVRNYLNFYDVNQGGVVSDEPVFSYKHTTTVDFDAPFLSYSNLYYQINENSGVALFGSVDQAQGNIPSELKLVFFDTSNSPNIVVTEERDIYDLLPENLHKATGIVTLRGKDDHFYVAQKARVQIDSTTQDLFIWLQWYDAMGKPIQKIDKLQIDDLDMDFVSDYTFVDSTMYILCEKIGGGPLEERLYYLIKSNKDTSIEKLSSFVKPLEFDEHSINFLGMRILKNKDILFYLYINYPSQFPLRSNASFLCRFDGKDLGLTTNVVDEELTETMFISPNPATDYIILNDISNQTISNLSVVDIIGNARLYDALKGNRLDISDLIPGNYFVRYYQNGKLNVLPFVKI